MSNHTPGPWMIRAERYRYIHVYAHGGGIAHLDTVDGEGMANANLIATAPDLLEVLEAIRRYPKIRAYLGSELTDKADAAISKARGEK